MLGFKLNLTLTIIKTLTLHKLNYERAKNRKTSQLRPAIQCKGTTDSSLTTGQGKKFYYSIHQPIKSFDSNAKITKQKETEQLSKTIGVLEKNSKNYKVMLSTYHRREIILVGEVFPAKRLRAI